MRWRNVPLMAFMGWAVLASSRAQNNSNGGGSPTTQSLSITLTNAPAAPTSASGAVQVQSQGASGRQSTLLAVQTHGLLPGFYKIEVERAADGVFLLAGSLRINDPSASPEREAGDSKNEKSSTYSGEGLETRTEVPLPKGMTLAEVGGVRVSTAGNTVLLAGKVAAPGAAPGEPRTVP